MESQGTKFFAFADSFHLIQVPEVWIIKTPDPQNCKISLLKTDFCYVQVLFKSG